MILLEPKDGGEAGRLCLGPRGACLEYASVRLQLQRVRGTETAEAKQATGDRIYREGICPVAADRCPVTEACGFDVIAPLMLLLSPRVAEFFAESPEIAKSRHCVIAALYPGYYPVPPAA